MIYTSDAMLYADAPRVAGIYIRPVSINAIALIGAGIKK